MPTTSRRSRTRGRDRAAAPQGRGVVVPITAATRSLRWSRIRTARARIAAGWYDRGEVQDQIADALARELNRR